MSTTGTIAVARTAEAVAELRDEWNALARRDPGSTPYLSADIMVGLWRTFAPMLEPFVVTERAPDGSLRGVLPLAWDRRKIGPVHVRTLGPLFRWHGGYFDVVVAPEGALEVADRLLRAAHRQARRCDAFTLHHLEAESRIAQVRPTVAEGPSRWIRLGAGGPHMVGRLDKNRRRTGRRLAEREPDVAIGLATEPETIKSRLHQFVALHRDRWAGTPTPSQFEDAAVGARFVEWLAPLIATGVVDFHVMTAGDRLLGGLCAFPWGDRAYGWRIAVTRDMPDLGLGIQLCHAVMAHYAQLGMPWYDIGRGYEGYKANWEGEARTVWRHRTGGRGVRWTMLHAAGIALGRRWTERFLAPGGPPTEGAAGDGPDEG